MLFGMLRLLFCSDRLRERAWVKVDTSAERKMKESDANGHDKRKSL